MTVLKMGVVGVGALGRHHARILSEMDDVELVAVAETSPKTGERVAKQCGTEWVSDFRQLFECVDAVSIVVPTQYHYAVASEFLRKGIPVLVEKPFACTLEEARELTAIAAQQETILQVGHIERFNPVMNEVTSQIESPKYIRCERCSPFAFRSMDIGVVLDVMIHDLDLILSLVKSPVREVHALGINLTGDLEDLVQARITFENGCVADVTACRISPSFKRAMTIFSESGCHQIDFQEREMTSYTPTELLLSGPSLIDLAHQSDADIDQLKQDVFETFLRVQHHNVVSYDALTAELTHFIHCIRTDQQPLVSGREGMAAMKLAEQILQSVQTHQWEGQSRWKSRIATSPTLTPQTGKLRTCSKPKATSCLRLTSFLFGNREMRPERARKADRWKTSARRCQSFRTVEPVPPGTSDIAPNSVCRMRFGSISNRCFAFSSDRNCVGLRKGNSSSSGATI